MPIHGQIAAFDPHLETWSSYLERLGHYFLAILLTVCGPSTYQLLKSLLQPETPNDKSYVQLVELLKNHYSPTLSAIMQRYKFNTRVRQQGESIATYVAVLKGLGEHCGDGDQLNDMVRDRLVCSIGDVRIQRHLLQETELTYKKAYEIAQAMEVATKDMEDLKKAIPKGRGPSLFGRNWLERIKVNWNDVNHLQDSAVDRIVNKHKNLFRDELGTLKEMTAKIFVTQMHNLVFFKPRPVPYLLKEKVGIEIEHLQQAGIIKPVMFSDRAAPVVPVVKKDGTVRLCGDYKVSVNQVSKTDVYPLPRVEDLFASLLGGKFFTKLDLQSAYQQICLDEDSKKYTTINTEKGLFQYERLSFGISSAPAIF